MDTSIVVPAISILASAPVIGLGSIWIVKTWLTEKIKSEVQHEYDLKLEGFKQNLIAEKAKDVEQFRQELSCNTSERNFRYSLFYKDMSETLLKVNEELMAFSLILQSAIVGESGLANQKKAVEEITRKFHEFGRLQMKCMLYSTPSIDKKMTEVFSLWNELIAILSEMADDQFQPKDKAVREKRNSLMLLNSKKFEAVCTALQRDFRQLLGFPMQ